MDIQKCDLPWPGGHSRPSVAMISVTRFAFAGSCHPLLPGLVFNHCERGLVCKSGVRDADLGLCLSKLRLG